ncbi:hypothetical protein M9H77_18977 [Catharanthus roseus]|uniref:Uncharacterized protein n=1 Tax=Catharanthus roseus TaxID=4058 RepID=A0ACC0B8Y7_CATRO|nr:hypothetical protein M9H77_18977 [Catharanthus roseus]
MYPGPIVPNILARQHEHRSGLIWSGDHETCFTDLQCRHFGCNPFQSYNTAPRSHFFGYKLKKEPLEAWILRAFTSSETDDDLILRIICFLISHAVWFLECIWCIWTLFHWSGAESLDIADEPNDITCPTCKKNIEISRYESKSLEQHRMFHFTLFSMNNDNEMCYLWTIAPNLAMDFIYSLNSFKSNNRLFQLHTPRFKQ